MHVYWNAILPGSSATEYSRKRNSRFRSNITEVLCGFFTRVSKGSALIRFQCLHKTHVNRNFQLEHINTITCSGKLSRQMPDLFSFCLSESKALLISDTIAVADYLQEERNIIRVALCANTLYKGVFHGIDRLVIVGIIVEQHFDRIGSALDNSGYRPF